ncbi:MAG: type I restriction endonuclease subunit R [Armatimonadetes bacterium]|nr:type I restriction endonuclease subunit R [Armatimonadota bacterium]MDE2206278.1 type I restriction endonuclease subunit R [Armatimonadota bacterium]
MTLSERQLEDELIEKLVALKYRYRADIRDRAALEQNFREKFQALNRVHLTDGEFNRLLDEIVTADVFTAAQTVRNINSFSRDDGTPLNYTLVNTKEWCKNDFEVINQLRINTDYSHHRYDVILLINGIPVVQIELKTLGINPRRAMEQIVEYKNDHGNGYTKTLLCFIQLFVVSNRDQTYYFANNNARHFAFDADERYLPICQFADRDNRKIAHLDDFAEKFLAKCTLSRMISRYMVLVQSERKLLMMRPYQIYAVDAIVRCIEENSGNGYIWHTTGSGKTLTSFKAATLLKANDSIQKVLFVVDRKDLDRQTREEFNRFQPGCVEENTNTAALVRRLLSDDYADKVIVTTIQKLGLALDEGSKRNENRKKRGHATFTEQLHPLRDKRMVIIFDECHRSQFGESHNAIKEFFPNAQLFGFTGTPIFEDNAVRVNVRAGEASLLTTDVVFQQRLHEYTITHAIDDGNVLRFHVDYFEPQGEDKLKPGQPLTRAAVVNAILEKHDAATGNRRFNALLATSSINDAIDYFNRFADRQRERITEDPDYIPLNIACVFSPPGDVSADVKQIQEDLLQEREDNKVKPEEKKEALSRIIADYNERYGTNHCIEEFDLYYQDVQKRIKDQQYPNSHQPHSEKQDVQQRIKDQQYPNSDQPDSEKIDVTIVVDMLLTGFDSKYLNTLYVDKNLRHHGLIQAFSRTNRILNATKPYGTILDFRAQQQEVDDAIAMFSGASPRPPKEIWLVDKAPAIIEKLKEAVQKLDEFMTSQGAAMKPDQVANLKGDHARVGFIEKFKAVQTLRTQLDQYTDLTPDQEQELENILPEDQLRGFKGAYLATALALREKQRKTGADPDAAVEEVDFELVLFASALIDYDYIMSLIARFSQQKPGKEAITLERLIGVIAADSKFLDERDLITEYVRSLEVGKPLQKRQVCDGYVAFKTERDAQEVAELAARQGLNAEEVQRLVDEVLQRRIFNGDRLTTLLEPLGLGWRQRVEKELALMNELEPLLRRRAGEREIAGLKVYETRAEYNADGE